MKILFTALFFSFALSSAIAQNSPTTVQNVSDQERERRALHKKKVREKLYLGAFAEGELAIRSDLMTTKDKRKKDREERENQ